ncbi:PrsW family glutamic-type intramembrane protease [Prolixibacter denitrificans]|uniref:Protease PrsW n=1 Tax=Prolixibacter denitrificans TaxID=1541063 RepID=A0A2P8CAM1_9BACT|nr:PrsW family glutamic-type intramembrane protease [Prolixibacter denitrificans]PSK82007.1 RsiW-degrading membrane proteinase PrsW (M82 family) [Prolixibacter denitrificans]GET22603.1 protease PrsW [Prolixibacter denitrificans]
MHLILLAIAPVIIILFYIYWRDKYEKEPFYLLARGLLFGVISVLPVTLVEGVLMMFGPLFTGYWNTFYQAFVVAGATEEGFKFLASFILVWHSREFNQRFDGIVYAVFVSMGFALVENLLYVFSSPDGLSVGLTRALTAVPAHAMFGVLMGFHLSLAKFYPQARRLFLGYAFLIPFTFHGLYDFILMSGNQILLALFVPFIIYMVFRVHRRMKLLSDADNLIHNGQE